MTGVPLVSAPPASTSPLHALGGIWRLTSGRFIAPRLLGGMVLLFAALAFLTLANVPAGDALAFSNWTTTFYLQLAIPVLTFLVAGGSVRDDFKAATVDYIFTRPVRRWVYLLFQYIALLACLQLLYLIALGVLMAVGHHRDIAGLSSSLPGLLSAQVLAIVAFTAFGFLCASVTTRFLVIGILYGGVVEAGLGNIPTAVSKLSLVNQIAVVQEGGPEAFGAGMTVLLIASSMLAAATVRFSCVELAGAPQRET